MGSIPSYLRYAQSTVGIMVTVKTFNKLARPHTLVLNLKIYSHTMLQN